MKRPYTHTLNPNSLESQFVNTTNILSQRPRMEDNQSLTANHYPNIIGQDTDNIFYKDLGEIGKYISDPYQTQAQSTYNISTSMMQDFTSQSYFDPSLNRLTKAPSALFTTPLGTLFDPKYNALFELLGSTKETKLKDFEPKFNELMNTEWANINCQESTTGSRTGNKAGNNLLMAAISGKHPDIADFLLRQDGINLDTQNLNGRTALHFAIAQRQYQIAQQLIIRKANPQLKDNKGISPYDYLKTKKISGDITKLGRNILDSLEHKVVKNNVNLKDFTNNSSFDHSISIGNNDLPNDTQHQFNQSLNQYIITPSRSTITQSSIKFYPEYGVLFELLALNAGTSLQVFESKFKEAMNATCANINYRCPGTGNNLLMAAIKGRHQAIAGFLLNQEGMDLNAQNDKYKTALHLVISNRWFKTAKQLLTKNANPELKDDEGLSPYDRSKMMKNSGNICRLEKDMLNLMNKKIAESEINNSNIEDLSIDNIQNSTDESIDKTSEQLNSEFSSIDLPPELLDGLDSRLIIPEYFRDSGNTEDFFTPGFLSGADSGLNMPDLDSAD